MLLGRSCAGKNEATIPRRNAGCIAEFYWLILEA
jgi:hypothetical protein